MFSSEYLEFKPSGQFYENTVQLIAVGSFNISTEINKQMVDYVILRK